MRKRFWKVIVAIVRLSSWIRHVLLRLDGLVQAVRPAAPREHAAGELVDDEDLGPLRGSRVATM
jgi:hypothetical protein